MNAERIYGGRKARLQWGVSLALAGKPAEAEAVFAVILAGNDRDTDALNNLAIAYRLQEKLHDALDTLFNAIEIEPAKAELQYTLGKVYKQLGNFKSAAMACARAVENDPSFIPAYINLGAAYYLLKDFGKAANFFKKGLALDPANGLLQANYEAALEAKRASESVSAPALPEDADAETAIFEAGDIFTGIPDAGTAPACGGLLRYGAMFRHAGKPAAVSGATPPYTLTGVTGLLRYLLEMAAFLPAPARKTFNEQGIGRRIEDAIDALSRPIPAPAPASTPNTAGDLIASLTGMLTLFEKLFQGLPRTEQQRALKGKIESILVTIQSPAGDSENRRASNEPIGSERGR
jgi:tetratricopeptide (TPR) repeat protein